MMPVWKAVTFPQAAAAGRVHCEEMQAAALGVSPRWSLVGEHSCGEETIRKRVVETRDHAIEVEHGS